jgi:hypothetical protein
MVKWYKFHNIDGGEKIGIKIKEWVLVRHPTLSVWSRNFWDSVEKKWLSAVLTQGLEKNVLTLSPTVMHLKFKSVSIKFKI